jgi:hypothetical protein
MELQSTEQNPVEVPTSYLTLPRSPSLPKWLSPGNSNSTVPHSPVSSTRPRSANVKATSHTVKTVKGKQVKTLPLPPPPQDELDTEKRYEDFGHSITKSRSTSQPLYDDIPANLPQPKNVRSGSVDTPSQPLQVNREKRPVVRVYSDPQEVYEDMGHSPMTQRKTGNLIPPSEVVPKAANTLPLSQDEPLYDEGTTTYSLVRPPNPPHDSQPTLTDRYLEEIYEEPGSPVNPLPSVQTTTEKSPSLEKQPTPIVAETLAMNSPQQIPEDLYEDPFSEPYSLPEAQIPSFSEGHSPSISVTTDEPGGLADPTLLTLASSAEVCIVVDKAECSLRDETDTQEGDTTLCQLSSLSSESFQQLPKQLGPPKDNAPDEGTGTHESALPEPDVKVAAPSCALEHLRKKSLSISESSLTGITKIGKGQYGDVYKARMGMVTIAMKTMMQYTSHKMTDKFENEITIMSQVCHYNVVRLYGIIREGPFSPALVMEFLLYGDLKSFLIKEKQPKEFLMKCMNDVAMGMHYLCERGLIHRVSIKYTEYLRIAWEVRSVHSKKPKM